MDQDERPVHIVVDCSAGTVTHTPLTDHEWDELRASGAARAAQEQQRAQAEQALREQVAEHPDPVVQALARRAGLL